MKKRESGLFNRLRGHVDESYEHVKQLRAEYEGRKPESVEGRVLGHGTETILQAYEYAKDEQEKAYKAYAEAKDSASRKALGGEKGSPCRRSTSRAGAHIHRVYDKNVQASA